MKNKLLHNFRLFHNATIQLILIYLLLLIVFAVFRSIILVFYNPSPDIYNEVGDLIKAYFTGFRFDTMVSLYGLLPAMILNILGIPLLPWGEKYYNVLKKIFHVYYTVLIVLFVFISIIDLYFYNFFMTRISVLIFGFAEDDTMAVIKAIWADYPVILLTIALIIIAWCTYKIVGKIQKIEPKNINMPIGMNFISLLLFMVLFVFGIRGTFAFYPLKTNDTIISQYVFINNLVPNGVYSLKTAFKDRKEQDVNIDVNKTMKKWGFSSPQEAVSLYTDKNIGENTDSLQSALIAQTPYDEFLEQNPPNVIFIQMESMSGHFISLHNKENFNLLGSLEDVLPECIHFTHFLSATDATIHTLEALLLNSPMTPISQSIYMDRTLETVATKPFKTKGYTTSFVTGSKLGWRNLDKFIPHQYFDRTEGSAHIEKHVKGVQSNEWGCYDGYMFDRIYDILQEGAGTQPQFVFGLTTTNHTPYSIPSTYKPLPINIPKELKSQFASGEEYAMKHFITYQYANNCLGDFIKRVKESPLGENTIIVASGDHSARRIFDYSDAEMLQKVAVPLIMYIPEKYKNRLKTPDVNQFGSHKDIFPTIYNMALSDAQYVKSGINLFDKETLSHNFGILGYRLAMSNNGCVLYEHNPIYYIWANEAKTILIPAPEKDIPALEKDMQHAKAYTASMTYLVQECLSKK